MYCSKCGYKNTDNAVFCGKCGNKFISIKPENESQKSYTVFENSTQEKKQEQTGKLLHTIQKFGTTYEIYDNKIVHKPLIGTIEYPFDKVISAEFKKGILGVGGNLTLKRSDGTSKVIRGIEQTVAEEVFKYLPFEHSIQKRKIFPAIGTIFIVFLMLLFLIGIFSSLSGNTETKSPSVTPVKTSPASQTIAKLGDKVLAGDFAFTFNNMTISKQISEVKKADGTFIILDVTIENIKKESKTILIDSYIKIIDDQGRTFNRDAMAGIYLGEEAFTFTQLQPGLPKRGKIVFDVPENINGKIELSTGLWSSDKKYVLLTRVQTTAPTPTSQVGTYAKPANVGTMIADDTAEFTVLEVNKDSRQSILTTNQYRDDAPPGYKFDLLKIQIKNIGTKELTVSSYFVIKIFSDGVEVTQAMMDSPKQYSALKGGTIMPGATMTGWIVATVPKDTGYLVQYKSNMFNSVGGWVQVN